MTAPIAKIFSPIAASLVEGYEMAHKYARQRVPDNRECILCFDERVTAETRVFDRCRSRRYDMDAMSKKAACIIDPLPELAEAGVRVTC